MSAFYAWIGGLAQQGILPSDFQYPFLVRGFLCVLIIAPILGGMSHLVVTRRMAFFSAALGQAAITGVALGLLLVGQIRFRLADRSIVAHEEIESAVAIPVGDADFRTNAGARSVTVPTAGRDQHLRLG